MIAEKNVVNCNKEQANMFWFNVDRDAIALGAEPRGKNAIALVMTDGLFMRFTAAVYSLLGGKLPDGTKPMPESVRTTVLTIIGDTLGKAMNQYFDYGFGPIKDIEVKDAVSDK